MEKRFVIPVSGAALSAAMAFTATSEAGIVSYSLNTTLSTGLSYGINMETGNVHLGDLAGDDAFLLAGSSLFVLQQTVGPTSLIARLTGTTTPSNLPVGFVVGATMSGAGWGTGSAVSFATGAAGAFVRNATNYFAVRFADATGAYRHGYVTLELGATNSQVTVKGISYEDSGAAITIVPGPGAIAVGAMARLASGRRRRG